MRHIFRPLANLTGLGAKLSDKERYSASGGSIAIVYVFGLRTLNERRSAILRGSSGSSTVILLMGWLISQANF